MTEHEKLTKLMCEGMAGKCGRYCLLPQGQYCDNVRSAADYLLQQGVIVLPCKIGDKVYQCAQAYSKCSFGDFPDEDRCQGCNSACDSKKYTHLFSGLVRQISLNEDRITVIVNWNEKWDNSSYEIGKKVFLSPREAESAFEEQKHE